MDEERYARRQARAKARKKQLMRQRMILTALVLAAVILVILAGITLAGRFLPQNPGGAATQSPLTQPNITQPTESTAPPTEESRETVIHIAAAGDLNVTDRVVGNGSYAQTFWDVTHLLTSADLTVLNFEGILAGAPYGSGTRSAPQELAIALEDAGVDLIQLANSYPITKGMLGLSSTINAVRMAGMEPLGVYESNEAFSQNRGYNLYQVQGIKVAFVAFTKGMDGMTLPAGSENCVNVLYKDYDSSYQSIDYDRIYSILDAVNQENPDIVIALLHWGSEYNDTISDSQKTICSRLKNRGVDVIIGTHSHYVQRMEFDPEKGTFVAYSLGDFLSDGQRAGTEYSVLLDLEITKNHITGQTKVSGYEYTPIFTLAVENEPLRILRIREAIAAYEGEFLDAVDHQTYEAMVYALGRIQERITDGQEAGG